MIYIFSHNYEVVRELGSASRLLFIYGSPRWSETLNQGKHTYASHQQQSCLLKSFLELKGLCRSLRRSPILLAPTIQSGMGTAKYKQNRLVKPPRSPRHSVTGVGVRFPLPRQKPVRAVLFFYYIILYFYFIIVAQAREGVFLIDLFMINGTFGPQRWAFHLKFLFV